MAANALRHDRTGVNKRALIALALVAVAMLSGACAPGTGATTEPSAAVVPIVFGAAPPNLGCDSIFPPYRSATIRIDPSQQEQIWAEADTGERLEVFWSVGFVGGSSATPVVADPAGMHRTWPAGRSPIAEAAFERSGSRPGEALSRSSGRADRQLTTGARCGRRPSAPRMCDPCGRVSPARRRPGRARPWRPASRGAPRRSR